MKPAALPREQAIAWLVEWRSGTMSQAQRQAFERWRTAQPVHEAAWAQVSGALDRALQPLAAHTRGDAAAADAAVDALVQQPAAGAQRRRIVGGALAVAGAGIVGSAVADRFMPVHGLLADARTATGERRTIDLADGSRLLLDARTVIDIDSGRSRRVRLREGALIADVADGVMPFVVGTRHGEVRTLGLPGTRCMVRALEARMQVAVLAQVVTVQVPGGASETLTAGQGVWVDGSGAIARGAAPAHDMAAWERGMLAVHDGTLGEVAAALRPYRRGFIRVSPAAARLRVLGTFPLDDTDLALQALADTLPVVITRYQGGWMVVIDVADGGGGARQA